MLVTVVRRVGEAIEAKFPFERPIDADEVRLFAAASFVRGVVDEVALIPDEAGARCLRGNAPFVSDDWRLSGSAAAAALRRAAAIHGWRIAGSGLIRRSGSQTRHLPMKSTKRSSLHLSTCASVLVPGRRRLPFELTTGRGTPVESAEERKHIDQSWLQSSDVSSP